MKNFLKYFYCDYKLRLTLVLVLLFILLFASARLALILFYPSRFESVSLVYRIYCFFAGLHFDLSIICVFAAAPLVFFNLPVKNKYYNGFWLAAVALVFLGFTVYTYSDLIYFPQVNRHISDELLHLNNDWGFIFTYVKKWYNTVFLLAAFFFSFKVWRFCFKYWQKHISAYTPLCYDILKVIILLILSFILIRGKFTGKSLGIADIYTYAKSPAQAAITGNAAFIGFHIVRKGSAALPSNDYPLEKAIKTVQETFIKPEETVFDDQYPLMRRPTQDTQIKDINFVIVLFEGWIPAYIDGITGQNTGATPNFDNIIKNGILFKNAYATGARSILGFSSVFASLPVLPDLPVLGYGLELTELSPLFWNFAQKGYYTLYAQTSLRHSFKMCALAEFLGAQETYGWEDMPLLLDYEEEPYYGYDYEGYMFVADKIKNRPEKNFLAAFFTGTTHEPFIRTQERFNKFKGKTWADDYRNSLYYADWALGQFLERAQKDGWFDNTVFIFVSDHSLKEKRDSLYEKFNIPLVMYAPKILNPQVVDYVASQIDIAPTLYALAGLDMPYSAFGRDLLDGRNPQNRAAFVTEGINIGLITKNGAIRHSRKDILSSEKRSDDFDEAQTQDKLLAFDKAALNLISSNKWFKNGK